VTSDEGGGAGTLLRRPEGQQGGISHLRFQNSRTGCTCEGKRVACFDVVSAASVVEGKRGDFPHGPRGTGRRGPSIISKAFSGPAVALQTPFPDAFKPRELVANKARQRSAAASRRGGPATGRNTA